MQYKHIVLTQFNLKLYTTDKNNQQCHTDEWLRTRFEYFEHYCLPSMMQQTCDNYYWMVFFDQDTPDEYKSRIKQYQAEYASFHPYYISSDDKDIVKDEHGAAHMEFVFRRLIREYCDEFNGYVLTTNVDNDDCLHKDTIARIQRVFEEKPQDGIYAFPWGKQLFLDKELLLRIHYPHNHFLTLAQVLNKDFKTVKSYKHAKIRKMLPVVDIKEGPPAWMEIVHEGNVSNDLRITSRVKNYPCTYPVALSDYGIKANYSSKHNISKAVLIYPGFWLATAITRLKRKLNNQLRWNIYHKIQ